MNIAFAQTFLEVVATGSFGRAAERLHVTHSAITMRIKSLEDLLGKTLLLRNKYGVSLTAEGAQFHRHAEAMVRAWQLMRRQMSLAPGLDIELSVGIDSMIFEGFLTNWITKMRETHPGVAVRCESETSARLTDMLFQGWLDLCLSSEVFSRDGIRFIQLFEDPLVLVSTEDRGRVDWDPTFIEIDWGDAYRIYVENHFDVAGKRPIIHVSQFAAGLELVQKFGGSIYMPERFLLSKRLARPMYRVHDVEKIERSIYLAYSIEAMESKYAKISLDNFKASVMAALDLTPIGVAALV